jgi:putative FmdB family regulatory protein
VPTYTYRCDQCGESIDRRQSFSDDPLTTCESCGGALKRVIYPAGIVFKGSGWYVTDYKNSTTSGPVNANGENKSENKNADNGSSTEKSEKAEKIEKTESSTASKESSGTAEKAEKPAKAAKAGD